MDGTAACFYVQQPNYYGNLEDCSLLGEITHEREPNISWAATPSPGAPAYAGRMRADIVVETASPWACLSRFGGPYLGFMTATSAMGRKLPGRIVGETKDVDGREHLY